MVISVISRRQFSRADGGLPECPLAPGSESIPRPYQSPSTTFRGRWAVRHRNVRRWGRRAAIPGSQRREFSDAGGGLPECPLAGKACGRIGKRPPGSAWRWCWAPGMPASREGMRSYRPPGVVNPRKPAASARYARRWRRLAAISSSQRRESLDAGGRCPECPLAGETCGHIGLSAPRIPESRRQAPDLPASPRPTRRLCGSWPVAPAPHAASSPCAAHAVSSMLAYASAAAWAKARAPAAPHTWR